MKCRSCGLEIAEKAIVCYRCGTPTADTAPVRPAPVRRGPNWLAVPVILVVIALAVWLIPMTPAASTERMGAWAALVVVTLTAALLLKRQNPRRPPRR